MPSVNLAPRTDQTRSIVAAFRELSQSAPGQRLFTFVDDKGRDRDSLTAGQLATAVDAVVADLRAWGLRPGDRMAMVYPPGLDFIKAFVGCLAAGVLPVPVYPPSPFRLERDLSGFAAIVADSGARAALTNGAYERSRMAGSVAGLFGRDTQRWPTIPWYRTDRHTRAVEPVAWHEPSTLDDPAFLQYTSGSTDNPKGVVITHGNLVHEIAANVVDLRLGPDTRGVFWIPQYHDMGLINVILSTVVGNSATHLMSPLTFLRRPAVWLEVMSRVRATITSAPNFAYELAVRKTTPEQRRAWDLSALRMAICAAEPVRAATVDAFLDAYAVTGLRPDAFFVAYGLAENTTSVTNRGQGRLRLNRAALGRGQVLLDDGNGHPAVTVFSCGRSSKPGDRIRIVDPDTRLPCRADRIGEIWVRSSTTAAGYWGLAEQSREVFQASTTDGDPTRYLRTGDLGFLHDGELYVTGRCKDLMIIRGRNVYPSDLEDSVRDCHPLIRPGGVLVFSVEGEGEGQGAGEGERIVVLVEVRDQQLTDAEAAAINVAVRRRVYADHQLACHAVLIGRVGLARKTTSGKLRRRVCAQEYATGTLRHSPVTLRVFDTATAPR